MTWVMDKASDVVEGVVDIVKDIGRGIDDLVHDVIPGGWATIGAGALLAVGIYNPSLLAAAESGTLTTGALEAAGVDAAATASAVASASPELVAATTAASASGVAPEIIAMANATADPIAALAAAQGSTIVDTAYLASIGAPETLIATATANNALLASQAAETAGATTGAAETGATTGGATTGAAETGATTGATETGATAGATETGATTGAVAPEAPGTTTQIFDDGSKIITDANGRVVSVVDSTGANFVPVEDLSGTGIKGLKPGPDNISLAQGATDLADAVYESLGPVGTAALLGGTTLAAKSLMSNENKLTRVGAGDVNYEWGTAPELVSPGLNPGYVMQAASQPFYKSDVPTDAQYYWGVHNPVTTPEDLNNYNKLPNAPATPWGAGATAVGGQTHLDIPSLIDQYLTGSAGSYLTNPAGPVAPVAPR